MTVLVNPSLFVDATVFVRLTEDFGGDWDAWLHYYGVETAYTPSGIQLTVPAGSFNASRIATGNARAVIQGAGIGQTLITITSTLASTGSTPPFGAVPRIDSVSAGSSTITLKDPTTFASQFVEGWYVLVLGWAMQSFGYPANNQFFDWVRLTDIDTMTGVMTLAAPLAYSYSDTWPKYTEGTGSPTFFSDVGGPATVFPILNGDIGNPLFPEFHTDRQLWDQTLIIRDLTIVNSLSEIWFGEGRSILWERCEFSGFPGDASVALDWTFRDCLFSTSDSIEIDKLVDELAFYNCDFTSSNGISVQSSSVKHMTMSGCTFAGDIVSTPKTFSFSNCAFGELRIGPTSYGATERGTLTNCTATSFKDVAGRNFNYSLVTSITDGVITIPYADVSSTDAINDLTPGTAAMLVASGGGVLKCFNIISVTQSGSDVLYTTDLPSSLPELAITSKIAPHGCPSITVSGCAAAIAPYNGTTAQPLFERSSITLTGSDASVYGSVQFGSIVSITIDVTQAYTGVLGTLKLNPFSQFGPTMLVDGAHGVVSPQYQANINLKIAGTRVILPGSTTGTQSGDVIPTLAAGDNWLIGDGQSANLPFFNNGSQGTLADCSGESAAVRPIVTVTVITDQAVQQASLHLVSALDFFSPSPAVDPSVYYTPGISTTAVSTADYYHMNGFSWMRPYDLLSMGAWGTALATAKGYRYFWIVSPDHAAIDGSYPMYANWGDRTTQTHIAYSNDPAVLPDPQSMVPILPPITGDSYGGSFVPGEHGTGRFTGMFFPCFVYNADTDEGHLYVQGFDSSTGVTFENKYGFATILYTTTDLDTWDIQCVSHKGPVPDSDGGNRFTSFQQVTRNGTGDWFSVGGGDYLDVSQGRSAYFTSTDGLTFTWDHYLPINDVGDVYEYSRFVKPGMANDRITYNGQLSQITLDDARYTTGGQYVSLFPIEADGEAIFDDRVIRLSESFEDPALPYNPTTNFPGPDYLQYVSSYAEDGVLYIWAVHGLFPTVGVPVPGAKYEDGGSLSQQFLNLYTFIYDQAAAGSAAPAGVAASCDSSTVTISWLDALPGGVYRVYRGTTSGTQATLIGDVAGTSITDTPTVGSLYYYKVVKLSSGVEQQHRVVNTYSSAQGAFFNKHMTRMVLAGVSATVDTTWLDTVIDWLEGEDLLNCLLFWTNPAFGVAKDGGNNISKIYDLGTTRLPRGGDYTTNGTVQYLATGLNSTTPCWDNTNGFARGYYGSGRTFNNIRQKLELTVMTTFQVGHSNECCLLSSGIFDGGIKLKATSGGNLSWGVPDNAGAVTKTKALTGVTAHILGGTVVAGGSLIAYVEGVASTSASKTDDKILRGQIGPGNADLLTMGSEGQFHQTANAVGGSITLIDVNKSDYQSSDLIIFDKALTPTQMASLTTLLRTRIGA